MKVKGNHPLAEIIAKRLLGISTVPIKEQRRMIARAIKEAVEYHEATISDMEASHDDIIYLMELDL